MATTNGTANPIKNVLVIGNRPLATSILLGLHNALVPYQITLLNRPDAPSALPSNLTPPPSNINLKTTDYTAASLRQAFAGQDLVISTQGGADYDLQRRIINAAVAADVQRFIPHEFGQDSLCDGVQERMRDAPEKAKIIKYLRAMEIEAPEPTHGNGCCSGHDHGHSHGSTHDTPQEYERIGTNGRPLLPNGNCGDGCCGPPEMHVQTSAGFDTPFSWVGIATGLTLDAKLASSDLGFDLKWQSATIHGTGSEKFAASSLGRIGKTTAAVVENWNKVKNQYLYVPGCVTTANEILNALKKETEEDWKADYHEVSSAVREGESRIEKGFPDAGLFLLERSVLYDESLGAVKAFEEKDGNKLLGLEKEKVQDVVGHAVHDFRHHGKADCGCG